MRVTTRAPMTRATPTTPWLRPVIAIPIVLALLLIFALDRSLESAPVQHLYYVPIVAAGFYLGFPGALATSLAAIVLYHAADPRLVALHYQHWDILQGAVFLAVGLGTAALTGATRRLRALAMTDDLTGLQNLRSFEPELTSLVQVSTDTGAPLSLFVLDVDHLKWINDRHGHLAGADAVRTVGHVIAASVPPEALACRYGGDEFVIAVPDCGLARGRQLADDLRRHVYREAPVLADVPLPAGTLSISIGVACLTSPPGDARPPVAVAERLFRQADGALYKAKANGRNSISVA